MCLFSSSNEIPEEDDDLAAAYDRFLLKFNVRRVQDKESDLKMHLTNLLDKEREIKHTITLEALQLLQKEVNKVKIGEDIIKTNFYIKRDIEKNLDGAYYINERTSVQSMRVVQAQALLQGRDYVIDEDLEVLKHTYWDDPSQIKEVAKTIISTVSYDKSKLNDIIEKLNTIEEFVKSDEDSPEANIRKLSNIERLKTEAMGLKTFLKSNGKSTDEAEKLIGKLTSTAQDLFNASYGG
jgi:MoxR-like ATPase